MRWFLFLQICEFLLVLRFLRLLSFICHSSAASSASFNSAITAAILSSTAWPAASFIDIFNRLQQAPLEWRVAGSWQPSWFREQIWQCYDCCLWYERPFSMVLLGKDLASRCSVRTLASSSVTLDHTKITFLKLLPPQSFLKVSKFALVLSWHSEIGKLLCTYITPWRADTFPRESFERNPWQKRSTKLWKISSVVFPLQTHNTGNKKVWQKGTKKVQNTECSRNLGLVVVSHWDLWWKNAIQVRRLFNQLERLVVWHALIF